MRELYVIAHNIRSTHNVGSLLRTAEGLGVKKVYLTGYTPYPMQSGDVRLPHIAEKLTAQIHKTALGAETTVPVAYHENIDEVIDELTNDNVEIVALEQTDTALPLHRFKTPERVALLLGEEVDGISKELLERISTHLVIPMYGSKESFNVSAAAAMALYELRFH